MKEFLKKEFTTLIVLALPYIYLAFIWDKLPDQIPSHFNLAGEVDGYSSKYFFPLINIFLYLVLLLLPKIDPKKINYQLFSNSYNKLRFFLTSFFSLITIFVFIKTLNPEVGINRYFSILLLMLFLVIGNYLSTIKPNWFIGIRTPWTMSSDLVWRKTHYLTSKLWFFGSLLGMISVFLANINYINLIVTPLIITMVIIPIIYSFVIFKKLYVKEQ